MTEYTILVPAALPDKCYLLEALYWRAFGRPPLEHGALDAPSFRESLDDGYNFNDFGVNNHAGEELEDDECAYAGLPPDPRWKELLQDRSACPRVEDTEAYWAEVEQWMATYEAYLDEFKAEICLDLKRGNISAVGRKLPYADKKKSLEILDAIEDRWDLPVIPIPQSAWVTTDIDWITGAIFGKSASYIWIWIPVSELLQNYPPRHLIKPETASKIGNSVIVSGLNSAQLGRHSRRGRPAYNWDGFHVEVARLYARGDMPAKKESAIALLQEWFQKNSGQTVSRSAIGARLKPYFDAIGKK